VLDVQIQNKMNTLSVLLLQSFSLTGLLTFATLSLLVLKFHVQDSAGHATATFAIAVDTAESIDVGITGASA